jgi:hypothetical protein
MMTEFATTRQLQEANILSSNTTTLSTIPQANMATTNMTENISVDLDQLLVRLSDMLLSPTADDSHIRATPYERNRISAVSICRFPSLFLSFLFPLFLPVHCPIEQRGTKY